MILNFRGKSIPNRVESREVNQMLTENSKTSIIARKNRNQAQNRNLETKMSMQSIKDRKTPSTCIQTTSQKQRKLTHNFNPSDDFIIP